MKREKRLTKKDRKAQKSPGSARAQGQGGGEDHIHCVSCGRHIEPNEFDDPATATVVACAHKSSFPSCVGCVSKTKELLAEHDRTGQPVKTAAVYH